MKKELLKFIFLVLLFTAQQVLAHPKHEHIPPLAAATSETKVAANQDAGVVMDNETLKFYFDLFTSLAYICPTPIQDEAISTATAIYPHLNSQPPKNSEQLAIRIEEFYQRIRKDYAVVQITWEDDGIYLAKQQEPVALARSVPRHIILEVHNHTDSALSVFVDGQPEPKQNKSVNIPTDSTRTAIVKLLAEANDTKTIELKLRLDGQNGAERMVKVPVKITAPATIKGKLIDRKTGKPSPARVYVISSNNLYHYGKEFAEIKTVSEKQLLQFKHMFYKLPFFYSDGTFEVDVPPGPTKIIVEGGFEHKVVTEQFDIKPGINEVTLSTSRFIDMKELGWVSGDTHIHWVKNHWSENESLELLRIVQRAEDIRVVNNLTLMHRTANMAFIAPSHFPMGPIPGYCDENYHIQMAEEYRNDELYGHLCFLNIFRLILPISTGKGVAGPDAPDYPINKTAILDCRSQGGISIEAHGLGRNWDVPVNVINKLTDSLDQIPPVDYYRFLNCGFRLPLTNGSDHPARVAGCARAYVKVDGDFTYEKWIDGIRKCRTFTTSGPLLFLQVNNADIGDSLDVKKGTKLKIKAKVLSRYPVGNFQVVSNGEVLKEMKDLGKEGEITFEIESDQPRWFVARCSQSDEYAAIAGPNIAHTSAVYVDVDGKYIFMPEAAEFWAEKMREHAKDIAEKGSFVNNSQKVEAVGYVDEGVKMFEQMIEKHTSN